MSTPGDYGDSLESELANAADQQGYILNSGNNTTALGNIYSDPNTNPNTSTDANSPFKAGSTYKNDLTSGISGLKQLVTDNKGWLAAAGALGSVYGGGSSADKKTGYQGTIPLLSATRSMITAPPTRAQGYRPGAGGINYGGDVTYALAPGQSPWANLSGTSASSAGANLTQLPANVAAAVANAVTGNTNTVTGGNKTTTVTGGGGNDTITKPDTRSAAMQYAENSGMGAQQYLGNINQWLLDHPYASQAQIAAEMKRLGVSDVDLQTALGESNFSDATKYGLTHGMGLQEMNFNINDWIQSHPYATNAEIQAEQSKYGVSDEDIARALTALNSSAGKEYAIVHDMGLDQLYKNILDFQRAGHTEQEIADAMAQYGISNADVKAAQNFAKATGYAEGGMAKGRYLQGETDGMADELPAQIGEDQPAALSHGEFVVPADVVSHLGNGNSDAGAKKLYQMMDKIRMARTGTKKQGKKINPDKFMPGGLAYAAGGKVKKFEVGGSTGTPAANYNAGLAGVESNLSNWAGPYVTNMLGQGQALANMPYQAYMGPLTAGESPLQTGAFSTAAGLTTPTSIGTAADTAGSIATKAQDLSYTPTTSTFDATQAQTYMNPYLKQSLEPQLAEARRQSQITQMQNAAKLTGAGAFGGSRQAIMDAETQRNLGTNLANITGQGYNTAYDKAMAQFNADQARKAQEAQFGATYGLQGLQTGLQGAQTQGQLGATQAQTGLANLNAQLTAGGQQRGIESEGIAADKAQFEEARANPYKMVQFQQSLLQGLPLAAQSYQGISPSDLTKAAQGATTVNALLKNLGLI